MNAKAHLIRLLQRAHAGELAAALAYDGHAKAVRSATEKAEISKIRDEELHHRQRLYIMLTELDAAPDPALERKLRFIGTVIAFLCRIGGWFLPMYGAGRLESKNIVEYEVAARLARDSGYPHFIDELLIFAEVEWDHERYFREKVAGHFLTRIFMMWKKPNDLKTIRSSYEAEKVDGSVSS